MGARLTNLVVDGAGVRGAAPDGVLMAAARTSSETTSGGGPPGSPPPGLP